MASPTGPKPDEGVKPSASANLLEEFELNTGSESWQVFDAWLENDLEALEKRFDEFKTHTSVRVSIGR